MKTNSLCRLATAALVALILAGLAVPHAHAAPITIDWVTVGDPGNTADTSTYGSVADPFRIMKFEFTNQQYTTFLNSVAATDPYSLYNTNMASNARGGITQSGSSGSFTYSVKSNMGDKPVNFVSWFDAARVANWLSNGATGTSSTETGAYTLSGATGGNAPAVNPGATFYIPTEDQWYKAAYYKGSGTNAGYWQYATQVTGTVPTAVTSGSTGIGTAAGAGNFANYASGAVWNGQTGNVTTVGTNGGPSTYGAFDMAGNVSEWNDLTGVGGSSGGVRGGNYSVGTAGVASSQRGTFTPSFDSVSAGFRLAAVPEPASLGLAATGGLAALGWTMLRRRKRHAVRVAASLASQPMETTS